MSEAASQMIIPFVSGLTTGLVAGVAIAAPRPQKLPVEGKSDDSTPNIAERILGGMFFSRSFMFVVDGEFYLGHAVNEVATLTKITKYLLHAGSSVLISYADRGRDYLPRELDTNPPALKLDIYPGRMLTNNTESTIDLTTLKPLPDSPKLYFIDLNPPPSRLE